MPRPIQFGCDHTAPPYPYPLPNAPRRNKCLDCNLDDTWTSVKSILGEYDPRIGDLDKEAKRRSKYTSSRHGMGEISAIQDRAEDLQREKVRKVEQIWDNYRRAWDGAQIFTYDWVLQATHKIVIEKDRHGKQLPNVVLRVVWTDGSLKAEDFVNDSRYYPRQSS